MTPDQEVSQLFAEVAPNIAIQQSKGTGFIDSVPPLAMVVAQIGVTAFPFLWKIFLVWLDRYANGKVSIKYRGKNGEEVTAEYSRLNREEVEELLRSVPPQEQAQIIAATLPVATRIEFRR